ncbi:hypothetical protein C6A88_24365 [Mycolicibacterium austroafricanum]|nr:hypothetical protein C6A88_24365 [Mycolicibacterium austroafricanum]
MLMDAPGEDHRDASSRPSQRGPGPSGPGPTGPGPTGPGPTGPTTPPTPTGPTGPRTGFGGFTYTFTATHVAVATSQYVPSGQTGS